MEKASATATTSPQELWRWTLTKEAIAPCFVRDVLAMKESDYKEADFFWLGRVPCRSILFVGLVVGIQVYEKRAVYSVDDGTGVIDCVLRHPAPPRKNATQIEKATTSKSMSLVTSTSLPPPPPPPVTGIGYTVKVVGKVTKYHDTRQIIAEMLESCDPNLELDHWDRVRILHETSYSLKDHFVPPAPSSPPKRTYNRINVSPSRALPSFPANIHLPSSPTSNSVVDSGVASAAPSPTKSPHDHGPPKLRHPSRLHSRDLTANTFRIYLKHYMDHAPPERDKTQIKSRKLPDAGASLETCGFSLSYLRRVPELALLASLVVRAEAKRRLRAEIEGKPSRAGPTPSRVLPHITQTKLKQNEPNRLKMKRLFGWALVKLYEEGSIILWDGPARTLPTSFLPSQDGHFEFGALWKTANSTMFSVSSATSSVLALDDNEEDAQLSEPEANEESYLPLTPALLVVHVRRALNNMRNHTAGSRIARGLDSEEVAAHLRHRDARWGRVGAWIVKEALDIIYAEGRSARI